MIPSVTVRPLNVAKECIRLEIDSSKIGSLANDKVKYLDLSDLVGRGIVVSDFLIVDKKKLKFSVDIRGNKRISQKLAIQVIENLFTLYPNVEMLKCRRWHVWMMDPVKVPESLKTICINEGIYCNRLPCPERINRLLEKKIQIISNHWDVLSLSLREFEIVNKEYDEDLESNLTDEINQISKKFNFRAKEKANRELEMKEAERDEDLRRVLRLQCMQVEDLARYDEEDLQDARESKNMKLVRKERYLSQIEFLKNLMQQAVSTGSYEARSMDALRERRMSFRAMDAPLKEITLPESPKNSS